MPAALLLLSVLVQPLPFTPELLPAQDEAVRPKREDLEITGPWPLEWFPPGAIFRNYLADPLTPRSGTKFEFPLRKGMNIKQEAAVGSQRTLFRCMNPDRDEGFDVGVEGAVITRFDFEEGYDLDSFDARWGFPLGYRKGPVSAKFHFWHLSSHVGDELQSRLNDPNIAIRYHKEEIALGFAYDWTPEIRTYIDWGSGVYIGTPNKRWKGEVGAEWVGNVFWQGPPYSFIAVDIKWRQETDWDTALCVQAGLYLVDSLTQASAGGLRMLVEFYSGRSPQTQFPEDQEVFWSIGVAGGL